MEINYFKEFLELAQIGNYTSAARKLNLSQSVLSKHIKSMEDELGVQFFIRSKRGIELSEYGQLMLPYARYISKARETYMEAIYSRKNGEDVLKIATIPPIIQLKIGELIAGFAKKKPNIRIHISEREPFDPSELLKNKQCDIAITRGNDQKYPELVQILYVKDEVIALMPKDHPLAGRKRISLDELQYEDLIAGNHTRSIIEKGCRTAGFVPSFTYSCNDGRRMAEMVEKCMGIAFQHRETADAESRNLAAVGLNPPIETNVYIFYHPLYITPMAEDFIQYILDEKRMQ